MNCVELTLFFEWLNVRVWLTVLFYRLVEQKIFYPIECVLLAFCWLTMLVDGGLLPVYSC